MPMARGEYAEALSGGLNKFTFQAYREKPEIYRMVNNTQPTDRPYVDDYQMAGFGALAPKRELGSTVLADPLRLGGTRIFMFSFALGFVISEELREDARFDLMGPLAAALGRSGRYTAELFGHDVYNDAFAGAVYTGRDGRPLCDLLHPIALTGGTVANEPSTPVDLSEAALSAAWGNFQTQTDDVDIPIDLTPAILFVHPDSVLFARQLLESSGSLTLDQNSGVINPIQGMVRVVGSPYLTDLDAWFVLAEPSTLDVLFYWRKTPDTKTWDDDDADGTIHKLKQRHGNGFRDWRGTYGSPGT